MNSITSWSRFNINELTIIEINILYNQSDKMQAVKHAL